ncbi:MAG: ankyrin repeat domain-containing protein [Alphaproteobacteria bacterium]|nr:ankyrin repeat domain-containing protein [Alphaproteobacteria bacterium]OJV13473.1 MAG: hypothetical protein BGO27_04605 [Alphaproteobacteria bacterium 33-17]
MKEILEYLLNKTCDFSNPESKNLLKQDPKWQEFIDNSHLYKRKEILSNTSSDGYTIWHLAAIIGKIDILQIMLDKKTDINLEITKGDQGFSALVLAILYNEKEIAEFLLKNGAKLFIPQDQTPYHYFAKFFTTDINLINDIIISQYSNYDINSVNESNQTALYFAVWLQNHQYIKYLLENKADPGIPDGDSKLPIYIAAENQDEQTVRLLLAYNAKFDIEQNSNAAPYKLAKLYIESIKIKMEQEIAESVINKTASKQNDNQNKQKENSQDSQVPLVINKQTLLQELDKYYTLQLSLISAFLVCINLARRVAFASLINNNISILKPYTKNLLDNKFIKIGISYIASSILNYFILEKRNYEPKGFLSKIFFNCILGGRNISKDIETIKPMASKNLSIEAQKALENHPYTTTKWVDVALGTRPMRDYNIPR